jgi:hypothetical protein
MFAWREESNGWADGWLGLERDLSCGRIGRFTAVVA